MRFTIKTKLACAFGAVVMLSILTGAVAYSKLNLIAETSKQISARAAKIDKAGELRATILMQLRAEKNAAMAVRDPDVTKFERSIRESREKALALRDEILIGASRSVRGVIGKFSADYDKFNVLEDEVIRFAHVNSNNVAARHWREDGVAAGKAADEAFGAAAEAVEKTGLSPGSANAASLLRDARLAWERAETTLGFAIAATDMEPLRDTVRRLAEQIPAATKATEDAVASLTLLGIPPNAVTSAADRLSRALKHGSDVVAGAGNILAFDHSATDVRQAATEALADVSEYLAQARESNNASVAASSAAASLAGLLLISVVAASFLIALVSAIWIWLNIARSLKRAEQLADAVASGDLAQRIISPGDDEIGDIMTNIGVMSTKLRDIVGGAHCRLGQCRFEQRAAFQQSRPDEPGRDGAGERCGAGVSFDGGDSRSSQAEHRQRQ